MSGDQRDGGGSSGVLPSGGSAAARRAAAGQGHIAQPRGAASRARVTHLSQGQCTEERESGVHIPGQIAQAIWILVLWAWELAACQVMCTSVSTKASYLLKASYVHLAPDSPSASSAYTCTE